MVVAGAVEPGAVVVRDAPRRPACRLPNCRSTSPSTYRRALDRACGCPSCAPRDSRSHTRRRTKCRRRLARSETGTAGTSRAGCRADSTPLQDPTSAIRAILVALRERFGLVRDLALLHHAQPGRNGADRAEAPEVRQRRGAACASRFQLAVFMACQMPFRFGCPSMRFGIGAASRARAAPRTAARPQPHDRKQSTWSASRNSSRGAGAARATMDTARIITKVRRVDRIAPYAAAAGCRQDRPRIRLRGGVGRRKRAPYTGALDLGECSIAMTNSSASLSCARAWPLGRLRRCYSALARSQRGAVASKRSRFERHPGRAAGARQPAARRSGPFDYATGEGQDIRVVRRDQGAVVSVQPRVPARRHDARDRARGTTSA